MLGKLRLMKQCFPHSWIRKLPLLLLPADTIKRDKNIVALCTTFRERIVLLCVHPAYRRQGLASTLIQRSRATRTDTYEANEGALDLWLQNGFVVEKTVSTVFGRKHILSRTHHASSGAMRRGSQDRRS